MFNLIEEYQAIETCRQLGNKYPHLVGKLRDALDTGLKEAFDAQRADAIAWEIIANTALMMDRRSRISSQYKKMAESLMETKIRDLATRGSLDWSSYYERDSGGQSKS